MVVYLKSREDVTMSDEDTGNEEGYYLCVCVLVIMYGIRQRWRTQVRKRLSFSSSFLRPIPWLSHALAQPPYHPSFYLL